MTSEDKEAEIQRRYYAESAIHYNKMHVCPHDEHYLALCFMVASIDYFKISSILDVGSGTGRSLLYIKDKRTDIRIIGIEPVMELREIGYEMGLLREELIEGDGTNIHFADGEFDLVSEFGVLHHVTYPEKMILEMLRVAKKGIFISDINNFGQGSVFVRTVKQILNAMGLWKVADFIKNGGKSYILSEGDGLSYSYSVFNNYNLINKYCNNIYMLNTNPSGVNLYRSADHVALLALKD
jgi:ubiquinone/menaquinone biosynthesis C-methylase UbiE